jgi:hypothetical protein
MSPHPNPQIALRHFSHTKPISCAFVSGNLESFFTVRIKRPIGSYLNITKGDPVTFVQIDENEPRIYGGFILSRSENDITISPDMTSFKEERRRNERYPVSLLGSIRNTSKKTSASPAWIKDISYEGIRICAECNLEVNDNVDVNVFGQNMVLDLEGSIVRKSSLFGRIEYGVIMSFRYKSSVFSSRDTIDSLILQEKRLIVNYFEEL